MKYMLMMNHPGKTAYAVNQWPHEDLKRHIEFMKSFSMKLAAAGELAAAEGLAGPDQAKLIKADKSGKPVDGPFPESKEFLAGYWIVDVASTERALAIAAEISLAPGKGGAPMYLAVEVRQVMSAPPVD